MRAIVFFDLPVETPLQRRNYSRFRKFLLRTGFLMMQESVYVKLAPNMSVVESICGAVRANRPPEGIVQMLTITEKQFNRMELVVGNFHSEVLSSDARLVLL